MRKLVLLNISCFYENLDNSSSLQYENVTLNIKNETLTSSSNQKLLGILLDNKFDLDEYVA